MNLCRGRTSPKGWGVVALFSNLQLPFYILINSVVNIFIEALGKNAENPEKSPNQVLVRKQGWQKCIGYHYCKMALLTAEGNRCYAGKCCYICQDLLISDLLTTSRYAVHVLSNFESNCVYCWLIAFNTELMALLYVVHQHFSLNWFACIQRNFPLFSD